MAKKFLKFPVCSHPDEHFVENNKSDHLGDIAPGEIFKKRLCFYPDDTTEWTSECLRQIADKLDELEEPTP